VRCSVLEHLAQGRYVLDLDSLLLLRFVVVVVDLRLCFCLYFCLCFAEKSKNNQAEREFSVASFIFFCNQSTNKNTNKKQKTKNKKQMSAAAMLKWLRRVALGAGVTILALILIQHAANVSELPNAYKPSTWLNMAYEEFFYPLYKLVGQVVAHLSAFLTYLHLDELIESARQVIVPLLHIGTGWLTDVFWSFVETVKNNYYSRMTVMVGAVLLGCAVLFVIYRWVLPPKWKSAIYNSAIYNFLFVWDLSSARPFAGANADDLSPSGTGTNHHRRSSLRQQK
jgi:hypothetical protein